MLSKFGKITFSGFIPDTTTAIIDFDNPESPRLAMTELQVNKYTIEIILFNSIDY
jgi:hypothetical protein